MPIRKHTIDPVARSAHSGRAPPAPLEVICFGALAFVFSSLAHEVVGHGGAAWLTGARIVRISSVYFNAEGARPIVDAAGPLVNLIAGGLLLLWHRCRPPASPSGRLLVGALTALNLFWGFGYFVFSGISGRGDWAFLFQNSGTPWVWRGVLIAVGLFGYRRSIAVVRKMMAPNAPTAGTLAPARPFMQPAVLLYLSAGSTCCFAALFYRGPVGPAMWESAIESFGAFVGLCFVASRKFEACSAGKTLGVPHDWRWTAASLGIVALYVGILGRGYIG